MNRFLRTYQALSALTQEVKSQEIAERPESGVISAEGQLVPLAALKRSKGRATSPVQICF